MPRGYMGCLAAKSCRRIVIIFGCCVATLIIVIIGRMLTVPPVRAQESAQSERETIYYRYLEFASLVEEGSIEPHWMADASSFWYKAERVRPAALGG